MRSKLLGAKVLDFNDDQGRAVKGLKVILTCPDPDWFGMSVTLPFIKYGTDLYDKLVNNLREYVNHDVDVDYMPGSGGKLKVVDIRKADQK